MPLQVTNSKEKKETFIRFQTIENMVRNFIEQTCKRETPEGQCKPLNYVDDSHSVHFSKKEIDTLFSSNIPKDTDPNLYGLRVYLGMHGLSEEERTDMPNRPNCYINQHTVILVCTYDGRDLLNDSNSVSIFSPKTEGMGLEEGQICPPPAPPCKGKLIFPQPKDQ